MRALLQPVASIVATDSQDGVEERPALGRLDLIVAIACLVALAAMAVPRQQRMSSDTRRMEVAALAASIDGAARFGHALWQAQGGTVVAGASGASVRIVNGYPEPETLPLLMEAPETMAFCSSMASGSIATCPLRRPAACVTRHRSGQARNRGSNGASPAASG